MKRKAIFGASTPVDITSGGDPASTSVSSTINTSSSSIGHDSKTMNNIISTNVLESTSSSISSCNNINSTSTSSSTSSSLRPSLSRNLSTDLSMSDVLFDKDVAFTRSCLEHIHLTRLSSDGLSFIKAPSHLSLTLVYPGSQGPLKSTERLFVDSLFGTNEETQSSAANFQRAILYQYLSDYLVTFTHRLRECALPATGLLSLLIYENSLAQTCSQQAIEIEQSKKQRFSSRRQLPSSSSTSSSSSLPSSGSNGVVDVFLDAHLSNLESASNGVRPGLGASSTAFPSSLSNASTMNNTKRTNIIQLRTSLLNTLNLNEEQVSMIASKAKAIQREQRKILALEKASRIFASEPLKDIESVNQLVAAFKTIASTQQVQNFESWISRNKDSVDILPVETKNKQ